MCTFVNGELSGYSGSEASSVGSLGDFGSTFRKFRGKASAGLTKATDNRIVQGMKKMDRTMLVYVVVGLAGLGTSLYGVIALAQSLGLKEVDAKMVQSTVGGPIQLQWKDERTGEFHSAPHPRPAEVVDMGASVKVWINPGDPKTLRGVGGNRPNVAGPGVALALGLAMIVAVAFLYGRKKLKK